MFSLSTAPIFTLILSLLPNRSFNLSNIVNFAALVCYTLCLLQATRESYCASVDPIKPESIFYQFSYAFFKNQTVCNFSR